MIDSLQDLNSVSPILAARLSAVQVGTPQIYGSRGGNAAKEGEWETSFFRSPSSKPRWLSFTHLEGNQQADLVNHGKPNQALLLYDLEHYARWGAELGISEIGPGGFGENFTVDGLSEESVCIGDICSVGDALIQVTGPRFPCWKIERRWRIPGLTALVTETGRTGWFCRVVREGLVVPGLSIAVIERPHPRFSIALTNDYGHGRGTDVAIAHELATCPDLDEWWQRLITRRIEQHQNASPH